MRCRTGVGPTAPVSVVIRSNCSGRTQDENLLRCGRKLDSFKIHRRVIAGYRGYQSFVNIHDEAIRVVVEKALSESRLWSEPLIQFKL